MRFSILCASAVLASSLALSACSSSTGSSSVPSAAAQGATIVRDDGHGLITKLMPGVKRDISCDYSTYVFCIYVIPGDSGPYVTTQAGSGYQLYNNAYIENNNKGKIDKKFKTYFSPDPGNPTSQYILYKGKTPKKAGNVKFSDFYCIGFSPSACDNGAYTFIIGIALEPPT
jgi:hypothetical protein